MNNRHNKTLNPPLDLVDYFLHPRSKRQKQYEAVRAIMIEHLPAEPVAKKFGYQVPTVYSLVRSAKAGRLTLFPEVAKGPQQRRTPAIIQQQIIQLRKQNQAAADIHTRLMDQQIVISLRTVERILNQAGFPKLKRRTRAEWGLTRDNKLIG